MHDRGFGNFDDHPICATTKKERKQILEKGIKSASGDTTADIVALMHIRRLISIFEKEMASLAVLCDKELEKRLDKAGNSRAEFAFADAITNFCDDIAFDFSEGKDAEGEQLVFASHEDDEAIRVRYRINAASGAISLAPWPLVVPYYQGFILGYQKTGYPRKLVAEVLPFVLREE